MDHAMIDWTATREELEKKSIETVLLPIGSIEQHGPHLPIGCDYMQAEALGRRVAEKLGAVLLLPALPFSNAVEHTGFPGTVCMRPITLMQVIGDMVESIRQWGFVKQVVLMNMHGGNWSLKPIVRELNHRCKGLLVIGIDPMRFYPSSDSDLHAGKTETSVMMCLFGEKIRCDTHVRDCVPENLGADYLDYVGMRAVVPDGIWGRPSKANIQFGERVVDEFVNAVVGYIVETINNVRRLRSKSKMK